eukprot:COSAG01_NODE_2873_length_6937_cov_8.150921_4_plen_282_part_00
MVSCADRTLRGWQGQVPRFAFADPARGEVRLGGGCGCVVGRGGSLRSMRSAWNFLRPAAESTSKLMKGRSPHCSPLASRADAYCDSWCWSRNPATLCPAWGCGYSVESATVSPSRPLAASRSAHGRRRSRRCTSKYRKPAAATHRSSSPGACALSRNAVACAAEQPIASCSPRTTAPADASPPRWSPEMVHRPGDPRRWSIAPEMAGGQVGSRGRALVPCGLFLVWTGHREHRRQRQAASASLDSASISAMRCELSSLCITVIAGSQKNTCLHTCVGEILR